jgi:hypothetical protein
MTSINPWPSTTTNPPVCFFNQQGLAGWLNQNPSYKLLFLELLPNGGIITSSLSTIGFDATKVPLCSPVQTLSMGQAKKFNDQLSLFRKVYNYNSNAYFTSITEGTNPIYYNFITYNEYNEYKSSVALINKMYNFNIMKNVWSFPFPITF